MKLSIIIESPCDLEKLISLLRKIDAVQKEGKYLFYRLVCLCENHDEKEFKSCLKTYKLNVPYSFWNKTATGKIVQKTTLTNFFEEELLVNLVDLVLLTKRSEISAICAQIAYLKHINIALIENSLENKSIHIAANYIFPLQNLEDADRLILKIKEIYKL